MTIAEFIRRKAEECRELQAKATAPVVIAELGLWACEFEKEAARAATTARAVPVREDAVASAAEGSNKEPKRNERSKRKQARPRSATWGAVSNATKPDIDTSAPRFLWLRLTPQPRLTRHRDG
ncbi:MAG TPA: hypothetical protein VJ783_10475 [Pirellulales bacterium]|nr:hypothetical protein [Pirellulales bacterium]